MTTAQIILNIAFFALGVVLYSIYIYRAQQSKDKPEMKTNSIGNIVSIALYTPMMLLPIMNLTEKWLSSTIRGEIELFFIQIVIIVCIIACIGLIIRQVALHQSKKP